MVNLSVYNCIFVTYFNSEFHGTFKGKAAFWHHW